MFKWLIKKFGKKKKTCGDNCGQCVFLGSKWQANEFKGLYCRKGYW